MNTKQASLKRQLQETIRLYPSSLRCAVAEEALDYDGNIEDFFRDLLMHGCQSGMVGTLIYYCDTHRFYDTHYDEIECLRLELEDSLGVRLYPESDPKNWFAWMAFEETARKLAGELRLVI